MSLQSVLARASQVLSREIKPIASMPQKLNLKEQVQNPLERSKLKEKRLEEKAMVQHEKLDEKRIALKQQLSLNLRMLRDINTEIDRAHSRRRSAREEKLYEVADRMLEKLPVLKARKNDLSQFKLKTIGKEFGSLMMQRAILVNSEEQFKHLQADFDEYCKHFEPRIYHYNMLLKAYENLGMAQSAESLIEEMYSRKLRIDGKSISFVIGAWIKARKPDKVVSWINNSRRRKIAHTVDASTLDKALHFLVESGEIERVAVILDWLHDTSPLKLSPRTIVALLAEEFSFWKKTTIERIELMMKFMDDTSFNAALSFCCSKGYLDASIFLLREMNSRQIPHKLDHLDLKLLKVGLQASNQLSLLQQIQIS
jgi:pentatricopeptide repeat protein